MCPPWLTPDFDPLPLFPSTATWSGDQLRIGGVGLADAVTDFGSPLYLLDEADFRARATAFREAFAPWPVYYASKAFLSQAVARWALECGLGTDVCSAGELAIARRGGVPPTRLGVHGNNKSDAELRQAVTLGVAHIVLDSDDEIDRLEAICANRESTPVLVRVTPDVTAHTHAHVQTAVADQKFGFSFDGAALAAMLRLHAMKGVELRGVHCHIGSQILDTEGYELAITRLVDLLAQFRDATGVSLGELGLGGGFGIAYNATEVPAPPAAIAPALHRAVEQAISMHGLDPLTPFIEPGRAIVGPACVAVYTVGVVKPVTLPDGVRTYVAVDGGMSDNPRPALYQSEYSALLVNRRSTAVPMLSRVVGKHCETGDVLVSHTYLPADLIPGDIIAVPASGAYQRAMASNYNGSLRPPVVAACDGSGTVLLRRETIDDLFAIDVGR